MKKIRVGLADDHRVVLEGIKILLNKDAQIEVVGEATDGLEAIALVKEKQPDVLVMDLMMPNLGGLEAAVQINKRFPKVKIIMLSMHQSEVYVMRALENGVLGYILKDSTSLDLITAIKSVMAGKQYISKSLEFRLNNIAEQLKPGDESIFDVLTRREREIFQLVAEGASSAQVAEKLQISIRTVESHRANLMKKLGIHTQTELIRFAIRQGVISIDG